MRFMSRVPLLLMAVLALSCERSLLGPDGGDPPPSEVYASRLATILDSLRYALDLPALAAAVVTDTGIVEARAVGSRRYGGPKNVTPDDQFHLGSCGKAFTAALIGSLVDEGLLTWSTTLPEIFPEHAATMRPEYKVVNVRNLLSHSAGFVRDAPQQLELKSARPRDQRIEVVAWALVQPPAVPRGEYLYSNLGFAIAGAVAERLTGRDYEDLVFERIIDPLGLATAGRGAMGTPGLEDQPLQHTPNHASIIATPEAHLREIYNPAGMLHMSVKDWGKFIQWVLASDAGHHQSLLDPQTARTLTAPAVAIGSTGFSALGWGGAYYEAWAGGRTLNHSGSNGYNYATAALAPDRRFGIIAMTNQGALGNTWLLGPVILRLITYHETGR
jgi:CubicO group peptidase (beta-lactamase class C family)